MERYAAEGVHETVIRCITDVINAGDVLDVPAGQGALAKDLEDLGFCVFPADLARDNMVYRNGRCMQINIDHSLPLRDEAFDCIVCVEGIEHVENPFLLIREMARVLKPGGHLIITTPNIMSIKSRLRFLLSSHLDYFKYFGPLPPEAKHRIAGFEHAHLTPVSYPQMRYMLEKYGFTVERIETNQRVNKWPLAYRLLKMVIRHKTSRRYSDSFYLSDVLLEGEILVFVAKK